VVDVAARRYRSLWWNGWKAIAKHDPMRRGKVLFGETAAISSPMDTLYAALCLGPEGKPFKGRMRELQGCANPRKLPIGGIAIHPYSKDAVGSVFRRAATKDSLPLPHVGRLHALIDGAARHGRIPRGRSGPQIVRGPHTADPDLAMASLSVLAATNANTVLPGHGEPWLDGVKNAVDLARRPR